jgi:preprotein translocase subunit SecG
MLNVLFVVHLFVAIALVAIVLLQRSEGGALGIGGGGGMSGLLSGRSTANLLTRTTAILAAVFIITSLALAKLSGAPERVQIPIAAPAATSQPAPAALPGSPPASLPMPGGKPATQPTPSSEPAPPIAR